MMLSGVIGVCVVLKHTRLISKIWSFINKWVINIEIVFIGTQEGLGFGIKWVKAFVTCGESGECSSSVKLPFM
jgi:hypothetical protein